jgi:hypothetical protein
MEEAKERLQELAAGGRLTPDMVVNDAEDPSSPLHKYFEWDESRAAHAYRLDQARRLIARVRVCVTVDKKQVCVPIYVRDPEAEPVEQGYVELAQIKTEKQVAAKLMEDELARVLASLERMESIAAVLKMKGRVQEIRKLADETRDQVTQRFAA